MTYLVTQTFYKAHGSNASWEWLGLVSPCVDMLRQLAKNFHQMLGADQGTRHAPPQLSKDIESLMNSLSEHNVYKIQKGRTLDDDDPLVKDIISAGFHSLTTGTKNPLNEYNDAFEKLQRRRRMKPVNKTGDSNNIGIDLEQADKVKLTGHQVGPQSTTNMESDDNPFVMRAAELLDDVEIEQPVGELEQILDDIEQGKVDVMFPVMEEEDVALDMDTVAVVESDDDDSMYTSDEE